MAQAVQVLLLGPGGLVPRRLGAGQAQECPDSLRGGHHRPWQSFRALCRKARPELLCVGHKQSELTYEQVPCSCYTALSMSEKYGNLVTMTICQARCNLQWHRPITATCLAWQCYTRCCGKQLFLAALVLHVSMLQHGLMQAMVGTQITQIWICTMAC